MLYKIGMTVAISMLGALIGFLVVGMWTTIPSLSFLGIIVSSLFTTIFALIVVFLAATLFEVWRDEL